MFSNKRRHFYHNPKIIYRTESNKPVFEVTPNMIKVILFLAFIGLIIWVLFFSNVFKIKIIEINGSLNPEVKSEIDKFYGKNILTFRPGKIKDDMNKKQSSIYSLDFFRGLPDTLRVQVGVRSPSIGWKTKNNNYFIDSGGTIFELQNSEEYITGDKKVIFIEDTKNLSIEPGANVVSASFVDFAKTLDDKLSNNLKIKIKAYQIAETTFQLDAVTEENVRLIFASTGNLQNQIIALEKIYNEKKEEIKEYVDLRVEGRVYYK